jgi:hypothetical protein
VQRVGGHDHAGKVQPVQQGLEGGHLTWGAVDLALGQHRAGGVVHRGEQVELPAVWWAPPAQGLAVDRDRPPALAGALAVGKPPSDHSRQRLGIQAGQRPARIVVLVGTAQRPVSGSRRVPSAARTGWGASMAHSAMAATDRAPATTPAAASPQDGDQRWRRPARALGSVTAAR